MGPDGRTEPGTEPGRRPPAGPPPSRPGADKPLPVQKLPSTRDERIDFIRGLVMVVLVVVHIEIVSLFTFFGWERVGLISGAEGFVILSGVVLGMISRRRTAEKGPGYAVSAVVDRAAQLYRVNVAVIVLVALLSLVPLFSMREVMTFTDRFAGRTYELYPPWNAGFYQVVGRVLLLRAGPHQIQILGLYVLLLLATPLGLWLLARGRTRLLLVVSFLVYLVGKLVPPTTPVNLTGAQFEQGFPFVNWQLIYFLGLAAGYHREALEAFFRGPRGRPLLALAAALFLGFLVLAQATPNPVFPAWTQLDLLPPATYDWMRITFFDKNTLGILRVVNYAAALVVAYALLTRYWNGFRRAFGWFLLPLGQASLYVFIVHVFVVALVANFRPFGFQYTRLDFAVNTLIHAAALLLLWAMVKGKVLFRWIPR